MYFRFAAWALIALSYSSARGLEREIERLEARIVAWHRDDETSRRLATIPGDRPDHGERDRRQPLRILVF
jgi:transposase